MLRYAVGVWAVVASACGTSPDALPDAAVDSITVDASSLPVRFDETFDDVSGPPFVEDYPELPMALFAADLSRWTQIQNEPAGNEMGLSVSGAGKALWCLARGQADGVASKMGLSKQSGFRFQVGDTIRLKTDLRIEVIGDTSRANTLLDLEDGDDILVDGLTTSGGLRIKLNDAGTIGLDRGEIIGKDDGVSAPDRLSNLNSDRLAPIDSWFTIEAIIKLGTDVARSTQGPIDSSFDGDTTAAWCEIWITEAGGTRELILRMKGSTFHDKDAFVELVSMVPDPPTVVFPDVVDFDVFQVGCTNNRSTEDARLQFDNVELERL